MVFSTNGMGKQEHSLLFMSLLLHVHFSSWACPWIYCVFLCVSAHVCMHLCVLACLCLSLSKLLNVSMNPCVHACMFCMFELMIFGHNYVSSWLTLWSCIRKKIPITPIYAIFFACCDDFSICMHLWIDSSISSKMFSFLFVLFLLRSLKHFKSSVVYVFLFLSYSWGVHMPLPGWGKQQDTLKNCSISMQYGYTRRYAEMYWLNSLLII